MADPTQLENAILRTIEKLRADDWVEFTLGTLRNRLSDIETNLGLATEGEMVGCICSLEAKSLIDVHKFTDARFVPLLREKSSDDHYRVQFFGIGSFELRISHEGRKVIAEKKAAAGASTASANKPKIFAGAFDTYTALELIARGGSGTVYKVIDSEGQHFALKVLTTNAPGKRLKRFSNEINFCLQPHSKNIVQILEYSKTEEGLLFYVMPYYPRTLGDWINKGIPPPEVLPLYSQILDGVEAAHLLGVFHRDIKPENILCDPAANALVVADFGISRFKVDDLLTAINTGPHEKLANFVYAAPEQRIAGKTVDHRADIYALGLILNQMFTGDVPQGVGFRRIGAVATEFAYLDELVELMIQQQPDERSQSVRAVKEELIARKNEFVSLQQLDTLKKQVIPESESNDPLISDPIRAVESEDYENRTLTLRLNRAVNPKWESCFRKRATSYSANVSAGQISFHRDRALLRADEHFLQQLVNYFRQYCVEANEEYALQVRQEHQKALEQSRANLRGELARREAKLKILQNTKL
jgi:serine/threonine protein kinase